MYEYLRTYRISVVRETAPLTPLRLPEDAARFVPQFIPNDGREHFIELILNTRNRVVGVYGVSVGGLNGAIVYPREVFQVAVRELAAAIIVAHNHPSGDPSPSAEDRALTTRLQSAGKVLGIELLDHVIIGHESYYSFKEKGEL